jgi:hypothetical protein
MSAPLIAFSTCDGRGEDEEVGGQEGPTEYIDKVPVLAEALDKHVVLIPQRVARRSAVQYHAVVLSLSYAISLKPPYFRDDLRPYPQACRNRDHRRGQDVPQ